jgi:hypothetical protein
MNGTMQDLRAQIARHEGTALGAGLGLLCSTLERDAVREGMAREQAALYGQQLRALFEQVRDVGSRRSRADSPGGNDFLAGLLAGRPVIEGGAGAPRPLQFTQDEAAGLSFPPKVTSYTQSMGADGTPQFDPVTGRPIITVSQIGELVRLGEALSTPEVRTVLSALMLPQAPSSTNLRSIARYFQDLMQAALGTSSAVNSGIWIPQNSPALADPALDVLWPVTGYNSSSLEASPLNTVAGLGALVLGAQATAICFKYGANQEQQSARSFRVKVTPTTTAGALFSAYLPAALRNNGAPKVHLQVEGIGVVAGGSPYVSAVAGGSQPYFTVATGTNPAATTAYNILCWVTN